MYEREREMEYQMDYQMDGGVGGFIIEPNKKTLTRFGFCFLFIPLYLVLPS